MRATRWRVASGIFWLPRNASDTVDGETPACSAIVRRLMRSTLTFRPVERPAVRRQNTTHQMNARHHLRCAPQGAANVRPRELQASVFSPAGRRSIVTALLASVAVVVAGVTGRAADLRIGIIGIDSSHSAKFGQIFNDPASTERVAGARIVCGFKGGSADMERSRSRVEAFSAEMRDKYGVTLVDSIADVVAQSDAIMILSVDGRAHLPQARAVFGKGKPVFIDKPFGGNLADSIALVKLARETDTRVFSSSNFRFASGLAKMKAASPGKLRLAQSYGPATIEPLMPDFYFYVVHVTESLYTLLGPGCVSVTRTHTASSDVATGVWSDGRTGIVIGLQGARVGNGAWAAGEKAVVSEPLETNFPGLSRALVEFFRGGPAPVRLEETLEIMAFMEAADESKRRGGAPVKLQEMMERHGGGALASAGK
jgi:hypothetical protein